MKKCVSCGAEMSDSTNFCAMCGGSVFQPVTQKQEPSNQAMEQSEPAYTAQTVQVNPVLQEEQSTTKVKKERKPVSGGVKILSVVCSLFLTILLIILCIITLVKHSLSEESFSSIGSDLEGKVADIRIGFLDESLDEDDTLSDFAFDRAMKVRRQYSAYINESISKEVADSIEDILNEPFLTEFIADTMSDYVSFILYDEGRGYIKTDDIVELIENNSKKVERISNNRVDDRFLQMVEDGIEKSGALKSMDLRVVEEENEGLFKTIRFFFSNVMSIVLIVVSVLLIVLIFVLRRDRYKAFTKTGYAFITTGIVSLLVLIGTFIAGSMLNNSYPFGNDIYDVVFSPIRLCGTVETIIFFFVGILFVVIGNLIKKKYK